MEIINLNKGWQLKAYEQGEARIDLPFDLYTRLDRQFDNPFGEYNGYCRAANAVIERELEKLPPYHKAYLRIEGVSGVCDIFVNGIRLASARHSTARFVDISSALSKGKNTIRLNLSAYHDSGRYTGLGISGKVELLTFAHPVFIAADGVFVRTAKLDSRAYLDVSTELVNEASETKTLCVVTEIFNQKNKRIAKKIKRVKVLGGATKIALMQIKLSRPFEWNSYDPYLYSCKVSILEADSEKMLDSQRVSFGVSHVQLQKNSLMCNNSALKVKGVVMAHDNGILGNVSEYSCELYKNRKIKEMGFNAVRYIGCPSSACLDALDTLGLMCVVDLFSVFNQSNFVNDGHIFFDEDYALEIEAAIKKLRNHPCVIMYSLGDNVEETYNRGGGTALIKKVLAQVKRFDEHRLTTVNAFERVPTQCEIERYEIKNAKIGISEELDKKALICAREKDLFRQCTQEAFSLVDVAGYSYLYGRYASDKARLIIGLANARDKMFEASEEIDKNNNVLGDFIFCGADFLGGMNLHSKKSEGKPHNSNNGLLDITYRKKEISNYNEIILGKRSGAYILVEGPDLGDINNAEFDVNLASHLWNWPRHIGKNIKIRVVTSGDIVSLTLDSKAVGRKLAGKFNKNIADFRTNFYPGKLEAVSYHKGVEQSRVTLETVSSPKLIKIDCATKSIKEGELCFVDIYVADKEGRLVPYALRDISVSVTGEGVLEMVGNGDPEHFSKWGESVCPAYNGVITAVVRATQGMGKIIVKATSEGLISNKATIKVK